MAESELQEKRIRYRVLGASLALIEFTVDDLMLYFPLPRLECFRVIHSHPQYIEVLSPANGGSRPHSVHRVIPGVESALRTELERLYSQFPKRDLTKVEEEGEGPEILALSVAEDIITRKWNKATDEEKRHIFYDARLAFRAGCREAKLYANTVAYIAKIKTLLDAAQQELKSKGLLS